MKVTLGQLITALNELEKIRNERMNIAAAFKVLTIIKRYSPEKEAFSISMRKLLDEYAEKDGEGNPVTEGNGVKLLPDKAEVFKKEMDTLLSAKIKIIGDDLLTLSDLENFAVSPSFLEAVDFFIKREE